ncbi:MAG: hypothetical protein ACXVSE_10620, partial [Solirubrobacteraceae bacterium]
PSLTSGCVSQTYTDVTTTLTCKVWWDLNPDPTLPNALISFPLNVESSTPSATAIPDRPPDANGWYNHPVSVRFQGGSAISGFAVGACTPTQTYGGPATAGTSIAGSCVDNAGKTASASFPFRYDATPPALAATSQPADGSVDLSWQASAGPAPLQWVQVARAPGVAAAAADVLYQGGGTSYQDNRVRNGTRYTYTVTAMDAAGNMSQQTVTATPGARLLAPAAGARLSAPPALAWTAIPRAAYYNVQLFKGRHKIMSAWPTRPGLRLKRTWRFGAHRHRLARGRYRWYVWPGFGARKAAHYGRVIGMATFTMR